MQAEHGVDINVKQPGHQQLYVLAVISSQPVKFSILQRMPMTEVHDKAAVVVVVFYLTDESTNR